MKRVRLIFSISLTLLALVSLDLSTGQVLPISPYLNFTTRNHQLLTDLTPNDRTQGVAAKKALFLNHLKSLAKRQESTFPRLLICNRYGDDFKRMTIPDTGKSVPVWWWDSEMHDKPALITVWNEGYGQYGNLVKDASEFGEYKTKLRQTKIDAEKSRQLQFVKVPSKKAVEQKKDGEDLAKPDEAGKADEKQDPVQRVEIKYDIKALPTVSNLNIRMNKVVAGAIEYINNKKLQQKARKAESKKEAQKKEKAEEKENKAPKRKREGTEDSSRASKKAKK